MHVQHRKPETRLPSAAKRATFMGVKLRASLILATVGIAGFAAASLLTQAALAWSPTNLPPGISIEIHGTGACTNPSADYYKLEQTVNGNVVAISDRLCSDSPTYQTDFDAWVNAHYTPPPTTTTTAPVTSTGASTTPAPTTTTTAPAAPAAPATVTTTATTTTTVTTAAPAATTTVSATPPLAAFTSKAVGLSLTFTDLSTVAAPATLATVTWHYGDGSNGTGSSASHVYTAAGAFTVVEIVTDSNGLASQASEVITVSPFGGRKQFAETLSPRLSRAVSKVFGQQFAVYCVRSWGAAKPERGGYGLSIVGSRQANIWQKGCTALTTGKGNVALALLVLGHEVAHALGVRLEKAADCYALAHIDKLGRATWLVRGSYAKDAAAVRKRDGDC